MKYSEVVKLRQLIIKSAQSLTDEEGLEGVALFPSWKAGIPEEKFTVGDRYQYGGKLYKIIQPHTTQEGYEPDKVHALWVEVSPPGVIPEWKQPTGAQDAYNIGDKVRFNAKVYESLINANVYSPTAYPQGWKLIP